MAGTNLIAAIFCCLGWPAVLVLVMSVVDAGCSRLWLLALGCLACFVFVVTQAQWESRLEYAGGAYIIGSARAPLWSPPPRSSYSDFQEAFSESEGFPPEPAATVVLALKWDWMLLDALLGLWAVTGLGSIFYLGNARHRVLRVAAFAFLGLTAGACATFGLWLVFGGWGPPMPELFGLIGLAVGIAYSIATMRRTAQQAPGAVERNARGLELS